MSPKIDHCGTLKSDPIFFSFKEKGKNKGHQFFCRKQKHLV